MLHLRTLEEYDETTTTLFYGKKGSTYCYLELYSICSSLSYHCGLFNGPDSIYSQKGFIWLVGYPPPPTVSEIHYWHEDLRLDP